MTITKSLRPGLSHILRPDQKNRGTRERIRSLGIQLEHAIKGILFYFSATGTDAVSRALLP